MPPHERHEKVWHTLYPLVHPWLCRKFNLTHEDLHVEGPVLLIPNHTCAWDPLLVAMSLPDKYVYYVASEHLFRLGLVSRLINWLVEPIPRRKASTGTDTVKACLRHLRDGHSICLFAEGEQCWAGINSPIFPATGKLAKTSGATLVTFRLEGAYLSIPRWGRGVRRGKVHVHPVGIYPPEQLRTMSPQEINDLIMRDTREDAWQRQRQNPVAYRGKRTAEGMEYALYLCPRCKRIGTLQTRNDRIFCRCGLDLKYTETGFFDPETPFQSIADWDSWQRETLKNRDFARAEKDRLFSDPAMRLTRVSSGHRDELLERGELIQYEDRLVCGTYSFSLKNISNMADVLANRLLFTCDGEYYQLRSEIGVNFRKYLEVWRNK